MDSESTTSFLLSDVARLMRKRFEQRSRPVGLTRSQWWVLVKISKNEGIHQSALAELLEIEPITLVRLLDKMETRNLVERRRHETDRRMWLLYLKPDAYPLLEIVETTAQMTRNEMFSRIPQEELKRFTETLHKMKANLLEAFERPVEDEDERHE